MAVYKTLFVIVILFLSTFQVMVDGQNFTAAREKIENAKPNIDYTTFCSETPMGEDKIACRINGIPSVGFLVCKFSEVVEEGEVITCKDIINTELDNIMKLANANIKTVTFSEPAIFNVTCGNDSMASNCSGFLEGWIDKLQGQFQQVRNSIASGAVDNLIKAVNEFTLKSGLSTTAADLTKIKKYMEIDPKHNQYQQICDLQGFFMKTGGFLVADTPSIDQLGLNDSCGGDKDPSTTQVLLALDKMIKSFNNVHNSNTACGVNYGLTLLVVLMTIIGSFAMQICLV